MKRFASLIFVFLMFGLPFALAQDAGFEGFEDMAMPEIGAGEAAGIIGLMLGMLPIIAFSKGGAAAAPLLDDGLELDGAPTSEAMNVANRRMAATDASRAANASTGAFSGATAFTIFACLGLLIFIGVIVLQTMEILYLDGTMDGNSIWPPKP